MTEKELKNSQMIELTDISQRIKYGLNALCCVLVAMEEGTSAADGFTDGLYFVYDCLDGKMKELENCIEAMKEQNRRETE